MLGVDGSARVKGDLEEANDNPIAPIDFAISTPMCTPTSPAQPGTHDLGTCGGPARRLRP